MLIIESAQMEALNNVSLESFIKRMQVYLTNTYPDFTDELPNQHLAELIISGIEQAENFGIDAQDDVKVYLRYLIQHGADFAMSQPWAKAILADEELSGGEKIAQLQDAKPL